MAFRDFDRMSVDEYRVAGLEEYARMHASAAQEDGHERCCNGSGWINTPYDTWVACRVHFDGQKHPEEDDEEDE